MPVTEDVQLAIACDNPACPGHPNLDPSDRTGWLFASLEVYGEPTASAVFGSAGCLSALSAMVEAGERAWPNSPQTPRIGV